MKSTAICVFLLLVSLTVTSCVEVTTARRSESVGEGPDGSATRNSEVVVKTYGWDTLAVTLHVITFPCKVMWHAVKTIL
jgi:hypothetical protein